MDTDSILRKCQEIADTDNSLRKTQEGKKVEPRKATFTTGLIWSGVNNKTVLKWQQLAGDAEILLKNLLAEENNMLEENIQMEIKKWLISKQETCIGLNHSLSDINGSDGDHSSDWETLNEHTDSGAEDVDNSSVGKESLFRNSLKLLQAKLFVRTNCVINETLGSEEVKLCKSLDPELSIQTDSGFQSVADSLKMKEMLHHDLTNFPVSSSSKLKIRKKRNLKERIEKRRRNIWNLDKSYTEEKLRHDIQIMRTDKSILVDQRSDLDDERVNTSSWTSKEETEFIYLDETIDLIDSIIELKNCLLLGQNYFHFGGDKIERILLNKLESLNETETFYILSKYLKKTLALRQSGYRLDQKMNKLEGKFDKQNWELRKIKTHIKQTKENLERELELLRKHYQPKVDQLINRTEENYRNSLDKNKNPYEHPTNPDICVLRERTRRTKVTRLKRKVIIEQDISD